MKKGSREVEKKGVPLPPYFTSSLLPDAVVIGGGPAGSSAAIRLARSGRHVRLYEKSHFPRAKLCGGFISPESLEDLEDLNVLESLQREGAVPLRRTVIASRQGTLIESPLPAPALSVSRDLLDDLLLREARRSGAQVFEGERGEPHIGEAAITVMAGGRLAHMHETRSRTPWYASPDTPYFGIQALFSGVDGVTDQVELDLIESGYVGLARQTKGINISILTTRDTIERYGPDLDKVFAHFGEENQVLDSHIREAQRTSPWLTVGPVRLGIRQLAHEQTFYVGDAACVVDPFAGEGMAMSLYSSQLLVRALEQKTVSPSAAYASLWKEAFMPSLRWNAVMRALYSFSVLREPSLRMLGWFPQGMNWLTDLTRYRKLESV